MPFTGKTHGYLENHALLYLQLPIASISAKVFLKSKVRIQRINSDQLARELFLNFI